MKHPLIKHCVAMPALGLILLAFPAFVSAATINLSPGTGTYSSNQPFTIDVVIDEKTDVFNAAQATVSLSGNLTVSDLVVGNCNFSFVKTPSAQNASFVGVILGGSKKNCTVYTLTVIPTGTENGTITIKDGSVKRYGDAAELLTAVAYGNYKIGSGDLGSFITSILQNNTNQLVPVTSAATTTVKTEKNLSDYTIAVKVVDDAKQPQKNTEVVLRPQLQAGDNTIQKATTDQDGIAHFKNVDPNIYTVRAQQNDKLIAEQIINAQGSAPVLTLGLQEEKQPQNIMPLVVGIIGMVAASLFLFRRRLSLFLRRS